MRILDYNPLTKESVSFQYNEIDDSITIGHHQDISNVLEYNKLLALDTERTKQGMKESFWHYAKIPNIVAMKWKLEHGVDIFNKDHSKAMFRLLNDPDNKYLRTTEKKHAIK